MEIKAILNKPYTENERINFIVEQNHKLGYIIEEQEDKLVALGYTAEELAQKEEDKINYLKMTALDFVNYIKKAGVSDEVILQYLQANPSIQLKLMLCQNVYCGVARQLCPIKITEAFTLTDEMVVSFFKKKHNIA